MDRYEACRIQPPYTPRYGGERRMDQCCAGIFNNFHASQCINPIKVSYGDLGYCGVHDPVKTKAKREARDAKYRAKRDAVFASIDRQNRRNAFVRECERAVREIAAGHNDAQGLARQVLEGENP